ncbi:MAG: hypothetical protein QW379_05445 [Thermoplasmata archaeon]
MRRTESSRPSKAWVLGCIVMLTMTMLPAVVPGDRQSGADLVIIPGSITISPTHPDVGDVVRVMAIIANDGEVSSTVDVFFYDGPPSQGRVIGSYQTVLGEHEQQPVSINWNTSGVPSGFHELWVAAYPSDHPEVDWSDNNASADITLTTIFSWVVYDRLETFPGPTKVMADILGVWGIGRLVIENSTIYFAQERDYQYGIVIDEQGMLTLRNSEIISNFALRILVEGNGQLIVDPDCTLSATVVTRDRAQVRISNSTLTGGLRVRGGNITASDSSVEGVINFERTNATIASTTVLSNETIRITHSTLTAMDSVFQLSGGSLQMAADTMNVTGSSVVWLTGVVSGTIDVRDTSLVYIHRYLTMHAEDTSGLSIPYATLWVRNLFGYGQALCQTTDKYGDARFTVITDILLPGPIPKPIGSYNITGVMGSVHAQTNIQLPFYPTMTPESNNVRRTIVFEPIFYQTGHSPWNVTTPTTKGDPLGPGSYTWSGDIYVWSTLTFHNVPLYIEQPSDFWAGVYIYPTGKMIFQGGGITSNKRLNVYIIGSGQLTIEPTSVMPGVMNINALVGLEDEQTGARGSFNARNIELNGSIMGTFSEVKLTITSLLPHPFNSLRGALVFNVEMGEIGNATIQGPPPGGTASRINVGQSLKFTNCGIAVPELTITGSVVSFSKCVISGDYFEKGLETKANSKLNLTATTISIIECELNYESIELSAQSFISTSTNYPIPLVFDGASAGLLTNVSAPDIVVNGSAEVTVQWLFTLTALDSLGTPVEGAEVTVRNYTTNATIPGGVQSTAANGKAVFLLVGKKVLANEVIFLGNYKVVVSKTTAPGESVTYGPYDISMRENVELTVLMDRYTNPLERLLVKIDNLSKYEGLAEGELIYCRGHVWKIYKGGYVEPAASVPVRLTLSTSGSAFEATTGPDGFFNITFNAPPPSERNITVTVTASVEGAEPGSDSVFNLSVPAPQPEKLRINIRGFDRSDRKYLRNKDDVIIYGDVEFLIIDKATRKEKSLGVASNATVIVSVPAAGKNFVTTTNAMGGFSVNMGKFSMVMQYTVTISASYTAGNLSLSAPSVAAVFTVKKAVVGAEAAPIPAWIIAVIGTLVVVIVAGVGLFLWRMQVEAAKLVECGACGAFIPENALKCPKCNTEFETEVVKCSACGAWIPPQSTECPKCGVSFRRRAKKAKGGGQEEAVKKEEKPAEAKEKEREKEKGREKPTEKGTQPELPLPPPPAGTPPPPPPSL